MENPSAEESAGVAIVDPIDWRHLDPRLASAIVKAAGSVQTVAKDATSGEGYKYATTAAVMHSAQVAMDDAKIHIPMVSYEPRDGWIFATFVVIHESGAASPDIHASIPKAGMRDPVKALGATLSYLRKYLYAAVLGIGWDDPTEDVDAQGKGKKGHHHHHQNSQQAKPKPKPKEDRVHPNVPYEHLLVEVRAVLRASPINRDRLWAIATGLECMPRVDNPEPGTLPAHQLRAVIQAERSIRVIDAANASPDKWTHSSYIHTCEGNEFAFAMRGGKVTADGVTADEKVAAWKPEGVQS